jgi:hypothetical protein
MLGGRPFKFGIQVLDASFFKKVEIHSPKKAEKFEVMEGRFCRGTVSKQAKSKPRNQLSR